MEMKERWIDAVRRIASESDRAAVVLAAAVLDGALLRLLKAYFRPLPSSEDSLLEGDSPLGTFSARIKVAHRLGLIDDSLSAALNLVRKIRNNFAHEANDNSLGSSPHRERVSELKRLFRGIEAEQWATMEALFTEATSPSGRQFRVAAALMLAWLDLWVYRVPQVDMSNALYLSTVKPNSKEPKDA